VTCREFAEFILDYVEGRLRPEVKAAFDEHLARCPQCVAYLDTYLATMELEKVAFANPEGEVAPHVPADLLQAILSSISRS